MLKNGHVVEKFTQARLLHKIYAFPSQIDRLGQIVHIGRQCRKMLSLMTQALQLTRAHGGNICIPAIKASFTW